MQRFFLLSLILSSPSWGAIAFVQGSSGGSQSGSTTRTTGATATTTGNLLVVGVRSAGICTDVTATITDTASDSFFEIISDPPNGQACVRIFIAPNITANATNVVTVTFGSSQGFSYINALEFSGLSTTFPRDASISMGCGSANIGSGCITGPFFTVSADEVIVFISQISAIGTTWTAGTGYTIPSNVTPTDNVISAQYKIVSALQTNVTANMITSTGNATSLVGVSLRAPVTGGGGNRGSVR